MNNTINTRQAVILGALLHDIGKFFQRAYHEENILSAQTKGMEQQICCFDKEKGCFTHKHVLWTNEFFEKNFPKDIEWLKGNTSYGNIANFACYHHNPSNEIERIITTADRLSAGIDRNVQRQDEVIEGKGRYKKVRLKPIFENIKLKEPVPEEKYRYELNPLSLDGKVIFPVPVYELNPTEGQELNEEYQKLWNSFISEFENLPKYNFDIFYTSLFYLLQKYTWCIPSSTLPEDFPDISLFDHLKTTAAIADCLYKYENSKKDINKEFLLLAGDISGIQNFIYKITQSEGAPGISKRLRGRSFYISLLAEVISKKIITETEISIANITFCGGGRFEILLPNTIEVKEKILNIGKETSEWLLKNFEGELGIVIEFLELNSEELKDYGKFLDILDDKLSLAKKRKHYRLFFQDIKRFIIPIGKDIRENEIEELKNRKITICKSCNLTLIPDEEEKICKFCDKHKKIGEFLPKSKVIVFAKDNINFGETVYKIDFDQFGKVYLISNTENLKEKLGDINIIETKVINETQTNLGGFTFLGNVLPVAKEQFIFSINNEEHIFKEGDVLDFETIAYLSTGDKRLGFLKMDVDYLGLIFTLGLEENGGNYSSRSISRISTLSRMIDLFFTGFLNNICKEVYEEWRDETNCILKDKIEQIFYISYSGGDDLLIIGPWSEISKLAKKNKGKIQKVYLL